MTRAFFGFYDMDAAPQHGVAGDLATRLGAASAAEGFTDGSVYVRSDNAGVAIAINHSGEDDWESRGTPAVLLQAADWRSRENDARPYRLVRSVEGDGDRTGDSTFFIIQRFIVKADVQAALITAICDHAVSYAQPIPGFLGADAYASLDGSRVVFVMPWAHEAALQSLENREGALAAMQTHLNMSDHHSYGSYQRISFLRAARSE